MKVISEAIASKESFEALAFCLQVKLCIKSSVVHDATIRRLKSMTGMGTDRIRRILSLCKAEGMIDVDNNNTMTINALYDHQNVSMEYVYKFKNRYWKRGKNKDNLRFNLTVAQVMNMLRKAVVSHHVKKVENIRQHSLLTQNPKDVNEYRKGKRFLRRLAVWGFDFFISNSRLAQIAGCSVSKLRQMKRELIKAGEILRGYSNTLIFNDASQFDVAAYRKYDNGFGFLFYGTDGKIYKHNPNVYSYNGRKLAFVPKKNK